MVDEGPHPISPNCRLKRVTDCRIHAGEQLDYSLGLSPADAESLANTCFIVPFLSVMPNCTKDGEPDLHIIPVQ